MGKRKELYEAVKDAAARMEQAADPAVLMEAYLALAKAAAEAYASGPASEEEARELIFGPFGSGREENEAVSLAYDPQKIRAAGEITTIDMLCRFAAPEHLDAALQRSGYDSIPGLVGSGEKEKLRQFATGLVLDVRNRFPQTGTA